MKDIDIESLNNDLLLDGYNKILAFIDFLEKEKDRVGNDDE